VTECVQFLPIDKTNKKELIMKICNKPLSCTNSQCTDRHFCPFGKTCALVSFIPHLQSFIHYCPNGKNCKQTITNEEHKDLWFHYCKYGSQCRNRHIHKHTERFSHPCSNSSYCTIVHHNELHQIQYQHTCNRVHCSVEQSEDKYHRLLFQHYTPAQNDFERAVVSDVGLEWYRTQIPVSFHHHHHCNPNETKESSDTNSIQQMFQVWSNFQQSFPVE
jgi:hypothetical protein